MATITGTDASDFLVGTADGDLVNGGLGNDTIRGLGGNDTLNGAEGNDDLDGSDGNDYLIGGAGNDTLQGGMNADTLEGGDGNDVLRGGKGFDSIVGGAGNDTLYSGLGNDTLTGGDGSDVFVLRGSDANFPGALKTPTITDFVAGTDTIAIEGATAADITTALAAQTTVSGGVQFSINGATVVVKGSGLTSLTSTNVVTEANIPATPVEGSTFSLTTGADVLGPTSTTAANQTTSGNDTIYALTDQSLTSADIVDGGAGTDSLIAAYSTAATVTPVLTNVENLTVRQSGNVATAFDLSSATGLSSFTFDRISDNTAVTAQSATNIGSAAIALGITNTTSDDADTFTFTFTDAALAGASDSVTLNVAGNSSAASGVVVIRGTTSTAANTGAETLTINSNTAASTLASVLVASGDGTTSSLKTLNVAGSSNLTITGALDFAGTTGGTINASSMTGNLTLTATTGNEPITFTGGSGNDTITTGNGNDNLTGGNGNDTFTVGTGNDTVSGGAGNDRVVFANISDYTANDSIDLGEGTRDVLAFGTITAVNNTNFPAATDTRITSANAEVVELTAANVSAIDFSSIPVDVVYLSGGATTQTLALTNVATNDVLRLTADHTQTAATTPTISAAGVLPGQTLKLELFGADVDVTGLAAAAATNTAITISSNITTLQIDSSATTATTATTNSIASTDAAAVAITNTSTQTVVITGNQGLEITGSGAAMGFSAGVSVDASAFTGPLTIELSDSNDSIQGGTGNDVITAGQGADVINLTAGGNDKLVFGTHANNGQDTITGFTGGANADTLNIAALGDGTTPATVTTISSAGAQQAFTDDTAYVINTTGAAANLTTSGTATVTDWTNLTQVSAYLNERFTAAATNDEGVFVVNVTGTTNSYVYSFDNDGTAALGAADFALVGVITTTGTALTADNLVAA